MDLSVNTKCVIAAVRVRSVASLVSLCDPGDCSPPDSSVHGTFQTRILEGVAIFPSPRDLPDPGIKPVSPAAPALQAFFTTEPRGKPHDCLHAILSMRN